MHGLPLGGEGETEWDLRRGGQLKEIYEGAQLGVIAANTLSSLGNDASVLREGDLSDTLQNLLLPL